VGSQVDCPFLLGTLINQFKIMPKKQMSKRTKWIIGLTAFFVLVIVSSLSTDSPNSTIGGSVNDLTTMQKIYLTFDGDYSDQEIKERLTKAMTLYGMPISDENYGRSASALVTLAKEYNIEEMIILDYMINELYFSGITLDFGSAAGISVTVLKTGAH
jgi:hypothetical protein